MALQRLAVTLTHVQRGHGRPAALARSGLRFTLATARQFGFIGIDSPAPYRELEVFGALTQWARRGRRDNARRFRSSCSPCNVDTSCAAVLHSPVFHRSSLHGPMASLRRSPQARSRRSWHRRAWRPCGRGRTV